MSAKCLDQQGRWRNKVVAFRMSPEEDELLETAVRLSGLTKQEYIIRRLQEKEVVVTGNPRVYKALKKELEKVLGELKRLKREKSAGGFIEVIRLITITMAGMKAGIKEPLSVGKHLKAGICGRILFPKLL